MSQRFNRYVTKEDTQWQICIGKGVVQNVPSEKCKLKQQQRYHNILIRMGPESGTLSTPNADEDMEQQELSYIAGGNAKQFCHFRRQFGNVLQTKDTLTLRSSNHTPWYLLKGAENLCLQKDLYRMFVVVVQRLSCA